MYKINSNANKINFILTIFLFSIPIFSLALAYYLDRTDVASFSEKELIGLEAVDQHIKSMENLIQNYGSAPTKEVVLDLDFKLKLLGFEEEIEKISREKNLILDPDVDSYYLISAQTDVLPMLMNVIIKSEHNSGHEIEIALLNKVVRSNDISLQAQVEKYGLTKDLSERKAEIAKLKKTISDESFLNTRSQMELVSYILELQKKHSKPIKDILTTRIEGISNHTQKMFAITFVLWLLATIIVVRGYWYNIGNFKLYNSQIDSQQQALNKAAGLSLIGEMAGNIGHEITTPLTVISGLAQKLIYLQTLNKLKTEDVIASAQRIDTMVTRISTMIKSIKAQVHIQEDLPSESVSLSEVIEETLVMAQFRKISSTVKVELDLENNFDIAAAKVLGLEFELTQVLTNLVSNAMDALTEQNELLEKRIWIKIAHVENNGRKMTSIKVMDNGSGVPSHLREVIWEQLFTTKKTGTGLGLSISKKIVERHGGTIVLKDSSDDPTRPGACFEVLLQEIFT